MNDQIDLLAANQTPIEIMLQIDNDGTVSARKVYEFLELDPSNYAKWCRKKISENEFAEKNVDYQVFVLEYENPKGGRPTIDYKLSISFAKKLCMLQKNERGEQARNYFIQVEELAKKQAQEKISALPNNISIEMLKNMVNMLEIYQSKIDEYDKRIAVLEDKKQEEKDIEQLSFFEKNNIYSTTTIGHSFKLSAYSLNRILYENNIVCPQGNLWVIADEYKGLKYSVEGYKTVKTGFDQTELREFTVGWTEKGAQFIIELLSKLEYKQYFSLRKHVRSKRPYTCRSFKTPQ